MSCAWRDPGRWPPGVLASWSDCASSATCILAGADTRILQARLAIRCICHYLGPRGRAEKLALVRSALSRHYPWAVTELSPGQAEKDVVLHHWDVPGVGENAAVRIVAKAGHSTTIVGANGAGKSALGLWMDLQNGGFPRIRRLIAHRRLWFQHAGPGVTSADRERAEINVTNWSRQQESRYLDHADGQRASLVLFDVLAKVNHENAQMIEMYDAGASRQEVELKFGTRLLDRLNAIFRAAGLVVELDLTPTQTLNAVNRESQTEYPIFQMSDGEKSALLLAAEVLTTPEESVYIIDEPERHLHRAISPGLIEAIIADRPDSHFVILTHDLELAAALSEKGGQVYSLTGCAWEGQSAKGWRLFPVDASAEMPESTRAAILGGRRNLLFIEGKKSSLDLRLYQLLFPGWTLFPQGGCDQVIRAVSGLRDSQPLHWLNVRGIVDGDGRTEKEKSSLHARGILPLPVSEVENLYYSDAVMKAVAARQAETMDETADTLIIQARAAALKALRDHNTPQRLAGFIALAVLRRRILEDLPNSVDASAATVSMAFLSPYPSILSSIMALLDAGDLDGLIRLVPIRDTAMRDQVARSLRFQKIADYEACARARIRENAALAAEVHGLIGPIPE